MRTYERSIRRPISQCGYSVVELSTALALVIFLLIGMVMIVHNTHGTSRDRNALGQLQDEERTAMTMLTDVIQQAGYHPERHTRVALRPSVKFKTAGQAVAGGRNAYGDLITVRYQGDNSNTVRDCRGTIIGDGVLEEMTFSVQRGPPNDTGPLELFCSVEGISFPLAANVHSLAISYGVDANGSGSTNTYLTADQMVNATENYWMSVYTVNVTVQFNNPLYGQPGQTSRYIQFSRAIGLMSKAGANSLSVY